MGRRKTPSFEEMMDELSSIVDAIGRDDCPVDELDERVKRAADLIRALRARLETTEASVREILGGLAGESGGATCAGTVRHGGTSEFEAGKPTEGGGEDAED